MSGAAVATHATLSIRGRVSPVLAMVCGRAVFDLLRRFPAAALPRALERRRIAHPKAQDYADTD